MFLQPSMVLNPFKIFLDFPSSCQFSFFDDFLTLPVATVKLITTFLPTFSLLFSKRRSEKSKEGLAGFSNICVVFVLPCFGAAYWVLLQLACRYGGLDELLITREIRRYRETTLIKSST